MINGGRAFERLKKLGFVRVGGDEAELNAAKLISQELKEAGIDYEIESFEVGTYHIHQVSLKVIEPYEATYEVRGIGLSGNTIESGLIADFIYVEEATPIHLGQAKNKVVLINGRITAKRYESLVKAGVSGIVSFSGTVIDQVEETDLEIRELNDRAHLKHGKIPSVTIRAKDALELVKKKASKIQLILQQDEGMSLSHNVIATVKGTEVVDEEVVLMAHYDSVPFSPGVYDNASGSSIIMECLLYFKNHPPKRSIKCIWFGSEEKGLYGSHAYTTQHEAELDLIKLGINVDMAGPVLGEDRAFVIADESLTHYVDYLGKVSGFPITVKSAIYSSDCIPFSYHKVPTISFARFGAPGCSPGHNRYDLIEHLSEESLKKTADFVLQFCIQMVDARQFPVPSKIPSPLKDEIERYLLIKK